MKVFAITERGTGDVMEIWGVVVSGVMCRMPALFLDRREAGRVLKAIESSGYAGGPWVIEPIDTSRNSKPVKGTYDRRAKG